MVRILPFKIIEENLIIHPQEIFQYRGYILDRETGEVLPGAHLINLQTGNGSSSNSEGFYQVALSKGRNNLEFSFLGYQPQVIELIVDQTKQLDIYLQPAINLPPVTVYDSKNDESGLKLNVDENNLTTKGLAAMPSLGSSMDVIRNLQFMGRDIQWRRWIWWITCTWRQ